MVLMEEQARLQEVANLYYSTAGSHGKHRAVSSDEWQRRAEGSRIMWQCSDPYCSVPAKLLHLAFRDRNGTLCNHSQSPDLGNLAILAAHGTCWAPRLGQDGLTHHYEVSPETFTTLAIQQHVYRRPPANILAIAKSKGEDCQWYCSHEKCKKAGTLRWAAEHGHIPSRGAQKVLHTPYWKAGNTPGYFVYPTTHPGQYFYWNEQAQDIFLYPAHQ